MKYVPAPAKLEIQIVNIYRKPMTDQAGGPAIKTYREWLLDRTADPVFLSHDGAKAGPAAVRLLVLAEKQINENCESKSPVHGYDNEVASRLRHAIQNPTGGLYTRQDFDHNWMNWISVWDAEPRDQPPAVLASAAE